MIKKNTIVLIVLVIILLLDIGYSFYQHYHMPLGGDFAQIVIPTPTNGYYHVLQDPLGFNALVNKDVYSNPNRFFAHWSVSAYFLNIPILLQKFVTPIDSVYLSCALAKIITQILIIFLLSVFISNSRNIFKLGFIIPALLVTPLFQTFGFNREMGIIDQSVIYTFFYALPLGLLLLFFLPFFKATYFNQKLKVNTVVKILLALFIVVLSLNGPLVPGVVLIVCPLVLLHVWRKNYKQMKVTPTHKRVLLSLKRVPNYLMFYFIGISVLSLYSLYIGRYNSLNHVDSMPLIERYLRLPAGVYELITTRIAYPLLFFMIILNMIAINKHYKSDEGEKILNLTKWIGIFAVIYILLLPLGGYRYYRPNTIRYDTLLPVTISLFFIFGATTFYLIKNISNKYKKVYVIGIIILLMIFTNADRMDTRNYDCERQAIETIAQSPEKIVELDCNCPIMEFRIVNDYLHSELKGELFYYWNITNEKKLFYQKDNSNK